MSTLRMGSLVVVVAVAALVGAVTALGAADGGAATAVTVTAGKPTEFRFTLSKRTVAKGVLSFKVTNRGTIRHDFKVGGKRTAILAPGKTATLRLTIGKAGKYTYMCTLPGHAAGGMKGTFTVK